MIFTNIKRICTEKNITIAELERATGIGNGVISRWDKKSPRVDNLKRVSDYLGCAMEDLIRGR